MSAASRQQEPFGQRYYVQLSAQQPGSPCVVTVHAPTFIAVQPVILGSNFVQHATGATHQ